LETRNGKRNLAKQRPSELGGIRTEIDGGDKVAGDDLGGGWERMGHTLRPQGKGNSVTKIRGAIS